MRKFSFFLIFALIAALILPVCYADGADISAPAEFDGYIVKLAETDGARLMSYCGLEAIEPAQGLYLAGTPGEVMELASGGAVEYFEPNYTVTLMDVPDDKYYSQQWNLEYINAAAVWQGGYSGSGVRVAVIDSGINALHEDLAGVSILSGVNVLEESAPVSDTLGHGTFVSGVIAAKRGNALGISGITDGVTLVPIKCFSDSKETSVSYIIKGIYAAVDDFDCAVINLSLGLDKDMISFRECIEHANSKGAIIVSAAGNSGGTEKLYPAAYDSVVGVGSISREGKVSSFSNHNSSVCVVAPGEKIISLGKDSVGYSEGSGTSYSVPHISAMAVVAKSIWPDITAAEFIEALKLCADDLGDAGYDEYYGYGSVNAAKLIDAVKAQRPSNVEFEDTKGHWAEEYISFAAGRGLFSGVSASRFEPETGMSRAMTVTVLARLYGGELPSAAPVFGDVPADEWYSAAVVWGAQNGVVKGVDNGRFMPDEPVNREQMAVFLWRYAACYGLSDGTAEESSLSSFTDAGEISAWAREALAWCVENGLVNGRTADTISPQGGITRAEAAAMLTRFCKRFA